MLTLARILMCTLSARYLAARQLAAEEAERNIRVAEVQKQLAIKATYDAGREYERKLLVGSPS